MIAMTADPPDVGAATAVSADGRGERSSARAGSNREDPRMGLCLVGFLSVHIVSLLAEFVAVIIFCATGDHWFFTLIFVPLVLSGLFCSRVAWYAEAPSLCPRTLPLRNLPRAPALLLCLPMGFLQGVIIVLALEDYWRARQQQPQQAGDESDPPPSPAGSRFLARADLLVTSKFHCKAVIGMFESLPCSGVLLYAYWTMGYPEDHPITPRAFDNERLLFVVLGGSMLLSSGLSLLEVDYCTSGVVRKRMRSTLYEAVHLTFRTAEIFFRISTHVWFMVTMKYVTEWFWLLVPLDFIVTLGIIVAYGGAESTVFVVRVICTVPCMFANIFQFIDSPYKRRAALRLSHAIVLRNAAACVLAPALAACWGATRVDMEADWDCHRFLISVGVVSAVVYFVLLIFIGGMKGSDMPDIYSASNVGSIDTFQRARRELAGCEAVMLNINVADVEGYTPLMLAARKGHAKMCLELLKEGASTTERVRSSRTSVRRCLSGDARREWSAVHMAARRGYNEVLEVLLEHIGSKDEYRDAHGNTPLHIAAQAGHTSCTTLLAARVPEWLSTRNDRDKLPMDLARSDDTIAAIQRSQGTLACATSAPSSGSSGASSEGNESHGGAWPQEDVRVERTAQLVAPGLCSFVASSCGGALGRLFCDNETAHLRRGLLTTIPEEGNDEESPAAFRNFGGGQALLAPGDGGGGVAGAAGDGRAAAQRAEGPGPGPEIANLVPADATGRELASAEHPVAYRFLAVPDAAVVGRGSFGKVWRAKDVSTKAVYAVKNLRQMLNRNDQERTMRELSVIRLVRVSPHPCIVRPFIYQEFPEYRVWSVVMEYCGGGTLRDLMTEAIVEARQQNQAYKPPLGALWFCAQVFLGLEHIHLRMKLLFRDVKPENIVMDAAREVAKLTDYGICRFGLPSEGGGALQSTGAWTFNAPPGSAGYCAPEIYRKWPYNYTADLYSFGVLIWVMLTGGCRMRLTVPTYGGNAAAGDDWGGRVNDYQALHEALDNPENFGVRLALPPAEKELVRRLTKFNADPATGSRGPQRRLEHSDIRKHEVFKIYAFPDFSGEPEKVPKWLSEWTEKLRERRAPRVEA